MKSRIPSLFVSYAQQDVETAMRLAGTLERRGFRAFVANAETPPGENFVRLILHELRRSDALVFLHSQASAVSPWCIAELYHAHALRVPVIPLILGSPVPALPEPLTILQRETHYVRLESGEEIDAVAGRIAASLASVRRHARNRWLRHAALSVGIAGAAVAATVFGIQRIEAFSRALTRTAILDRVGRASGTFTSATLDSLSRRGSEDDVLLSTLLWWTRDPERSSTQRLNAEMLSARLLAPRSTQYRWVLRDLNWRKSDFGPSTLSQVTLANGLIDSLRFWRTTFAGVAWGRDLTVTGASFDRCSFEGGVFDHAKVLDSVFRNCSFRGTRIDLTTFSEARFETATSDTTPGVVTDELTSFENVEFINEAEPPRSGTMDFRSPDLEVRFSEVVFVGCRFKGFVPADWFRLCSFEECTFPDTGSVGQLKRTGQSVTAARIATF